MGKTAPGGLLGALRGIVEACLFLFGFEVRNLPIYYICDGERSCKNSIGCGFNKNRIHSDCFHTKDEKHARYGKCEGSPEWYPERFVDEGGDLFVERKRY